MAKMKDSELKEILAEVEAEIGQLLKSESETLAKAKEEDHSAEMSPAPESSESASAAPAPEASTPAAEEKPAGESVPSDPGSSAAPPAAGEMQAAPEAAPAHEETPGEIHPAADPEALKAEYCKLSPEELKMHYLAAKAALFDLMGASDASAPAPAAPMAAPMASPTMKGEDGIVPYTEKAEKEMMSQDEANGGEMGKSEAKPEGQDLKKSEDLSKAEDKIKEMEGQLEVLAKALESFLTTPVRKAVTSTSFVPKTEEAPKELTKSEVQEKLKEVTKRPDLKKSERDLINSYCYGNVGVDKIQHLLK